jgi:molybdenum cofactor guanylyltransferase
VDISCIALAGGKSSRLGRNKLTEIIGGRTLFEGVLNTLAVLQSEIIVVTSTQPELPEVEKASRFRIVSDAYPGAGSLGGICTGLEASNSHLNIVVACDMPFLNTRLLKYMVQIAKGFDLVAFNKDEKFEPMHAIFSKNCIAPMRDLIRRNSLRIIGILPSIKVRYITDEELDRFDPDRLSFFNINTEADLQRAREIEQSVYLDPRYASGV